MSFFVDLLKENIIRVNNQVIHARNTDQIIMTRAPANSHSAVTHITGNWDPAHRKITEAAITNIFQLSAAIETMLNNRPQCPHEKRKIN